MLSWFHYILLGLITAALIFSVFYSFRSRTQQDAARRGLYTARMNISMGLMLVGLALLQLLVFEMSTVRVILGTVFLLLGLFNLFAGLKNQTVYRTMGK